MLRPAYDIFCNLYGTDGVPLLEENFKSGKTQITFTLIDQLIKKVSTSMRNVFLIKNISKQRSLPSNIFDKYRHMEGSFGGDYQKCLKQCVTDFKNKRNQVSYRIFVIKKFLNKKTTLE